METLEEVEKEFGLQLPAEYKWWVLANGPESDAFRGSEASLNQISQIQEWASELLSEDNVTFCLPEKGFVFLMHQGYQFMYFICDGSNDPAVWHYLEGAGESKVLSETFSGFVSDT